MSIHLRGGAFGGRSRERDVSTNWISLVLASQNCFAAKKQNLLVFDL